MRTCKRGGNSHNSENSFKKSHGLGDPSKNSVSPKICGKGDGGDRENSEVLI